jgi:6-phosphogluconolactonase
MSIHFINKIAFVFLAMATLCGVPVRSEDAAPMAPASKVAPDDTLVYVGTYTTGAPAKGIYLFKLHTGIGDAPRDIHLVPLGLAAEIANTSFLIIDKQRRRLFAVTESNPVEGEPPGLVSAYSIEPTGGKLTLLNRRSSRGAGPCHLALDASGRHIVVANYYSGSVAVLPIIAGGYLGESSEFVQYEGHGTHPTRQKAPHAHCATFDPTGRFVYVCDLGSDKVYCYRFDGENGKLLPNDPAMVSTTPGAGPRHIVFRPDGRFAYLINELNSTITVFSVVPMSGRLTELQNISTLPTDFEGPNTAAGIALHPTGNFLYATNRGHNSVVVFKVDREEGVLKHIAHQDTLGKTPRHFDIDRSGAIMAITNQDSGNILVCRMSEGDGRLKPARVVAVAPEPACVQFLSSSN